MTKRLTPLFLLVALLLGGCASIGPGSVTRDRFDYNVALADSWKRQVVLNVVKLRYVEPISFVDVGQIVSAYTMESGASLSGTRTGYDKPTTMDNYSVNAQLSGKYTDRPTITYTPLTGKTFLKSVMLCPSRSRTSCRTYSPGPRRTSCSPQARPPSTACATRG